MARISPWGRRVPRHQGSREKYDRRLDVKKKLWSGQWQSSGASMTASRPRGRAVPARSSVHEVLNFFENCPQCGYPATATAVIRELVGGSVETEMHLSCGVPCGWTTSRRMPVTDAGALPS